MFLWKQSSSSEKRVDNLRFSCNWRDSIKGHRSANGSKDGRLLEPSLVASKMPAFFPTIGNNFFPLCELVYGLIQQLKHMCHVQWYLYWQNVLSFSTSRNLSAVFPWKTSYTSKTGCVSSPNLSCLVFTCGRIISSGNFKDSVSLL